MSDGQAVWFDPRPVRRRLVPPDLNAIEFVAEVFLPEAQARGTIDAQGTADLCGLLDVLAAEARRAQTPPPWGPPRSAPVLRTQAVGPVPFAAPRPVPAAAPTAPDPAVAARRRARSREWERARASIGSDLGVHGLAYLGVLLLFVGVFGLVAFAFADVTPSLRPVAEVIAASVPFLAARMLLRNGAGVVGRALEVVGGLFVPIMLITSMVDGYPFPPDPDGGALVVGAAVACVLCGAAYVLWSGRFPDSGLRYIVGPAVWLAAAMATIGVGRPLPSGQDVAVPSSYQLMAMAAALALTLALARLRPEARLALPALITGVPGVVVVALLAVVTWGSGDRPALPVAVTGVLLLASAELVRPRLPDTVVDVVGTVWWGVVAVVLIGVAPAGLLASGAAAGFLVLLELAGRRAGPVWSLLLPATGLTVCLFAVWVDAGWAAGALAVAAAWAILRRTRPFECSADALDVAAAVLPAAAVGAFGLATSLPGAVTAGTCLVVGATALSRYPVLRRTPGETFWSSWWRWAVPVLAVIALADGVDVPPALRWWLVGSLAVLALTGLVGPVPSVLRPWVVTVLGSSAWLLACETGGVLVEWRGGLLALAGLAMVVSVRRPGPPAASVGLAGHVTSAAALALAGDRWGLVGALALATAGWAVTAVRGERSAVGRSLTGVGALRYLPWTLVAVGLPATVAVTLDVSGALPMADPWAPAVLAGTAVVYAAGVRLGVRGPLTPTASLLAPVASWVSFVAGVLAAALSRQAGPAVIGLAALVVAVVLLPAAHRATPMGWTAWAAATPLLGLLARQTVPWFGALPVPTAVAVTLVAVGGALLIGATAVDPRAVFTGPRRSVLTVPLVLGAAQVVVALVLAVVVVLPPASGWIALTGAGVMLTVAVLTRTGALAGFAVVVAWGATLRLTWPWLEGRPWASVAVAVGLVLAAQALHRWVADRDRWRRWDIPMLVAAAPAGATALVAASDGDAYTATYAAVGLLTAAVAIRVRRSRVLAEVLGWVGTALVLIGAADAGSGWTALALLALAAVHTGLAVRAAGGERIPRQVIGVVATITSWLVALDWFAWAPQVSVDATAVLAGSVVLLASGVARTRRLQRSWVMVWGGAGVLVTAGAAVAGLGGLSSPAAEPSLWVVLGLGLVAAGAGVAAAPLQLPGLRDLAVLTALAAVVMAMGVAQVPAGTQVTVLSAGVAVLAVLTLALAVRDGAPVRPWLRPGIELGAGAALVAVVLAMSVGAGALVPAIAATAVQVAAAGVALRSVGLQMTAPVLACTAWLVFVTNAEQPPQWYTVAIGLTLLAVVSIWRRDRRAQGVDVAAGAVVPLELAGIAFVVGASLVQAATQSPLHAVVAVVLGLLIAVWGVLTQVRRRVGAGALVVLVAVVLMVAVPLVSLLPAWGGAGVWLLLAGVGLVAVLAATMIERGRTAVRAGLGRIGEITAGWE